jgi:hypothetical protein
MWGSLRIFDELLRVYFVHNWLFLAHNWFASPGLWAALKPLVHTRYGIESRDVLHESESNLPYRFAIAVVFTKKLTENA